MTWAHFLAIVSPNGEVAMGLSSLFMSVFSLFAGFMITKPQIPDYWISFSSTLLIYINFCLCLTHHTCGCIIYRLCTTLLNLF